MAAEVGFIESFALADDREKALEQLIPGSEESYYFRALFLQQEGRFEEVDSLLTVWAKRRGRTQGVREMENRQLLYLYSRQPKEALVGLRKRLGVSYNHQRVVRGADPSLPTSLPSKLISEDSFRLRAFKRHGEDSLAGFEDSGLPGLANLPLSNKAIRDLLRRMDRADVQGLPQLIVRDLLEKDSRGFGSLSIHNKLTLLQLYECATLRPSLSNEDRFVRAVLSRLQPGSDVNWQQDTKAREAYLDRLWNYVKTLDRVHNSLKAHVLYHRLVHDRSQGKYDAQRFEAYLKLPRDGRQVNPKYLKGLRNRKHLARISTDYRSYTLFPAIRDEDALISAYLDHFFVKAENFDAYRDFLSDGFLKRRFAETKILNGIGDQERWYSMLSPTQYRALKDRVDIQFAPTNSSTFEKEDRVALDVSIKNVKTLLVKVFEVNTGNFYRSRQTAIDTAIDLDGLIASDEKVYEYGDSPFRRVTRHFEFPALDRRGVWVVEMIGGGVSSRALVRKGRLHFVAQTTVAGQRLTVYDDDHQAVPGAEVWLSGHHYRAADDGSVTIPFSTRPGKQTLVLTQDGFSSLTSFSHLSETYRLSASIHVDREQLLDGGVANVLIRPSLSVAGTPVTVDILKDAVLEVTTRNGDGVTSTATIKDLKLKDGEETVQELRVPSRLRGLSFQLRCSVENVSRGKPVTLSAYQNYQLNGIDSGESIFALFLTKEIEGYSIEVRGRTGETRSAQVVRVQLQHRDYTDAADISLQTNESGRVFLGPLEGIETLRATGPGGVSTSWPTLTDENIYPSSIHVRSGEKIRVPYMGKESRATRDELGLMQKVRGKNLKNFFPRLSVRDGFVEVSGLKPGDYRLDFHRDGHSVDIRVADGEVRDGIIHNSFRKLERNRGRQLQVSAPTVEKERIRFRVDNASTLTRVHVIATRFTPAHEAHTGLSLYPNWSPRWIRIPKPETHYVVGRDIGDEYRYILDRKYAKNMLARPGLLLNPWAISDTRTTRQMSRRGGRYASKKPGALAPDAMAPKQSEEDSAREAGGFPNLDFLSEASVVVSNVKPNKEGWVEIALEDLGGLPIVQVVAVGPASTVSRSLCVPTSAVDVRDLALGEGLDPKKHFSEAKKVSIVRKGEELLIADTSTAQLQVYDTLRSVFGLFKTLSSNPTLNSFDFLVGWPKLDDETKLAKYSEFSSHELNYFLYRKDPEFFAAVVQPYLRNKLDKTFLDLWLLGEDLTAFLDPWAFAQLNVVERILLAQRLPGEAEKTARHVRELFDLLP
ncbi:MAG: hypothetical protein AAF517_04785, partial [Planctomycetota bacterium]